MNKTNHQPPSADATAEAREQRVFAIVETVCAYVRGDVQREAMLDAVRNLLDAARSTPPASCAECARLREALRDCVDEIDEDLNHPDLRDGERLEAIGEHLAALRAPSTQREE